MKLPRRLHLAAGAAAVREEDILKNYPMTYRDLTTVLKRRYSNFLENKSYHLLRKKLEKENKFSLVRVLNPNNSNSSRQLFYNTNIMQECDKHYERRKRS